MLVDLQIKERKDVHTRKYYHYALTRCVMDEGETSLCTGRAEFGAVLVDLQMNEKRRAHKEILLS